MPDLDALAEQAGIEESYWDIAGGLHITPPQAKRSILSAMGIDASTPEAIRRALKEMEERRWRTLLQPVYVIRSIGNAEAAQVTLALPVTCWNKELFWHIELEDTSVLNGVFTLGLGSISERKRIDGQAVALINMPLPENLPFGYHKLAVESTEGRAETSLIITPSKSYTPPCLEQGERLWGIACHLYSLRSEQNWGIGDFSDLASFCKFAADSGASTVGINPLHALFPVHPAHISPYSPSSRAFLNPIYIDISVVPEFVGNPELLAVFETKAFSNELNRVRSCDHVDYPAVSAIKLAMLAQMFEAFVAGRNSKNADLDRYTDYDDFVSKGGKALHQFSLFQVLHEYFQGKPWREWPVGYQKPDSLTVRQFANENEHRIGFHMYQQWLADRQLSAAVKVCKKTALKLGLYFDLAIGADPYGFDAWSEPDVIVPSARFGAPPDALNAQGQDWGLPPAHPKRLKDHAYGPFIDVLRANMHHAGALRIDHVMGLLHLYWIPPGEAISAGAYVRYPFDDLLGIVALESHRNRCLVIGEDLGTVPDGFRMRMTGEGLLSYRILRFERYPEGLFKRPEAYPEIALSTSGTHDLPTIKGYWKGHDLDLRKRLGMFDSDQDRDAEYASRDEERRLLVAALQDQNLVPDTFPDARASLGDTLKQLVIAIERFLARSPSRLLLVNLDDLLLETDQLNLPGTVDEYANWRRKSSATLESLGNNQFLKSVVEAIARERR